MEAIKDIFVPKEIAQELKKIGFNESCIAYYQDYEGFNNLYVSNFETDESISTLTNAILVGNHSTDEDCISAPTWEQVFKWFRNKGIPSTLEFSKESGEAIYFGSYHKDKHRITSMNDHSAYESAREELVLKLIKSYKDG